MKHQNISVTKKGAKYSNFPGIMSSEVLLSPPEIFAILNLNSSTVLVQPRFHFFFEDSLGHFPTQELSEGQGNLIFEE